MRCIHCQHDNPADAHLCGACGQPPSGVACPACGAPNPPSGRFCGSCGQALRGALPGLGQVSPSAYTPAHLAEKILVSRSALEGERKQVTILFCDIANSTPLASSLGAERMHALLNRFFGLALEVVHRYEGTINQFLGDGFMALFGAPIAHEDHTLRAVRAALDIQHTLRQRQRELLPAGERIAVRMGLNSGPVVVGKIGDNLRMDYTAVGDTTNLAARLQQLAQPDTILASDSTQRAIAPYVETVSLGIQALKGLAAQPVHRIVAAKPGATRFHTALHRGLSPFLARAEELAQLNRELDQARTGGIRIVALKGEPGIGKSRLIHEFCRGLSPEEITLARGDCVAYGGARAFLPFIQVIKQLCGIEDADPLPRLSEKCARLLAQAGIDDEAALPLLLNLLCSDLPEHPLPGWDPQLIGARTRQLLVQLLTRLSTHRPLVIVLEDLQWADAPAEELVRRLADCTEPACMLLLVSFRPDYAAAWAGGPNTVELPLAPLPDEACRQLILARLGIQAPVPQIESEILSKAEGNPLFAEELVQYFSATGTASHTQPGATLPVPSTVQDLVMARVDRLPEQLRILLRTAAVVGRRFGRDVVQRACAPDGAAVEDLERLEHEDLIRSEPQPERREYIFKHALIQEAIYDSLLSPQRSVLHERVAESLEAEYPDRLREWSDVLAHHYSRTTRHQKAARYLLFSGERHLQASSLTEAERCFREAIAHLESEGPSTDPLLIDAVLDLGYIHYYRHDLFGMEQLILQYRAHVDDRGDARQRGKMWMWIETVYVDTGQIAQAETELRALLAHAEASGDPWCFACAWAVQMWICWMRRGDHPVDIVEDLAERSLGALQHAPDVFVHSQVLLCRAIDALTRGRIDDARRTVAELTRYSDQIGNPRTQAFSLYMRAYLHVYLEEFEEAVEFADRAAALAPDPFDRLCALGIKGTALTLMNRAEAGLDVLSQVRAEIQSGNFLMLYLFFDVPYGAALVLAGRMSEGVQFIEAAIERFSQWGNETQPAFGHLVLGDIYTQIALGERKPPWRVLLRNLGFVLRVVPVARRRAYAHLRQAIELAARIDNHWLRGQAHFHLAKLEHAAGHRAGAIAQLRESQRLVEPLGSTPLLGKIARLGGELGA